MHLVILTENWVFHQIDTIIWVQRGLNEIDGIHQADLLQKNTCIAQNYSAGETCGRKRRFPAGPGSISFDREATKAQCLRGKYSLLLNLSAFPRRGRVVPELKDIGVLDYREVFFKPYRILYFIETPHVYVIGIFDGRRDLEELLHRRLFP